MLLAEGAVQRSSALMAEGISPHTTADALRSGVVVRSTRGTRRPSDADDEAGVAGLAAACARMPKAVVCLTSAAYLAGLADAPSENVWLALPLGAYVAKVDEPALRVIRWSAKDAFEKGIVQDEICGVLVRRTGPARTIVDLLRYARHCKGDGPGIEAARRFFADGGDPGKLLELATRLRTPSAAMKTIDVLVRAAARRVP